MRRVDRLNGGERVAAISALALFALMFFDWFGAEVAGNGVEIAGSGVDGSAWSSLALIPILLTAAIVATLLAAALRLVAARYRPALPPEAMVAVLGGLATLLVLFRVLDPPSDELGGIAVEATLRLPVFLALIAAAGIAVGGYTAMRARGLGFGDVAERLERSAGARLRRPSPRRPAPPPASRRRSRSSSD